MTVMPGDENTDNAVSFSDMEAAIVDATVKSLDNNGDTVTSVVRQYTYAAADGMCPEGWTWPVKANVDYGTAGDNFSFAPASASAWSGYGHPNADFLKTNDAAFFAGQKAKQSKIDDGSDPYWKSAGGAHYIWAGYMGPDVTEKVSANGNFINDTGNGNGNAMFLDNSGVYAYFGNHNTATAECRCVKKAE
jgi:hypothetical protein